MPFTTDFARHPTAEAMREAAELRCDLARLNQWESLGSPEQQGWRALKEAIARRGPAILMIDAHTDFGCDVGADYVTDPTTRVFRAVHAVLCVGYDDDRVRETDGARVPSFHVLNSFGRSWGEKGLTWVPYDVLVDPMGGADGILRETYVLKDAAADCADPVECFPRAWSEDPTESVWPEQVFDQCARGLPPRLPAQSEEDVLLPPGAPAVEVLRGPRVPCVPALMNGTAGFAVVGAWSGFTLTQQQPDREAVGAWVETIRLTVTDRLVAPNPIVVRATVLVPGHGPYAVKEIRVHLP
jgi:hypothetical protein